jgi:hypothetical protein
MTKKRIDWATVRDVRKRLAQLAREHPELTGPSSPENVAAWEEVLRAEEGDASMVRTMGEKPTGFRLTPELVERMDEFARQWAARSGLGISRADVARKAILRFMAAGVEAAMMPDPAPIKGSTPNKIPITVEVKDEGPVKGTETIPITIQYVTPKRSEPKKVRVVVREEDRPGKRRG